MKPANVKNLSTVVVLATETTSPAAVCVYYDAPETQEHIAASAAVVDTGHSYILVSGNRSDTFAQACKHLF